MASKLDTLPRIEIRTRAEWRLWLKANHASSSGAWLVTFKKESGQPSLPYNDAVEEALCFGWVDSKPAKLDAARTMLLMTPRKPSSAWSRANKERIERLVAADLMAPAGLAVVEAARASGKWDALNEVEALVIPTDLAAALQRHHPAAENWESFPRSAKRGILEWIVSAKRPETRANRIEETARLAATNERANQWPRPSKS